MIPDTTRKWITELTSLTLANDNEHQLYLKVPIEEGVTTSEWIASESHIDPIRDDGYIIYKLGRALAVVDGKREVCMLWGRTGKDGKSAYQVAVDNGFVGTEVEWLESLQGEPGQDGVIGIEDIAFEFCDVVAGTAKDYTLDISAIFAYNILSCFLETDNGTLTGVAVKIGTTAVTSLSSITVDTAVDETTATGANAVVVGDRVKLSVAATYTGTPTLIRGKLKIQRT